MSDCFEGCLPLTLTRHHRVSALESVHEEALHTLGSKLGEVGAHLSDRSNAESVMQNIVGKFALLESKISSQSELKDRIAHLESKLPDTFDLHSRIVHLEGKAPAHSVLTDRLSRLESQLLRPDPEHDRMITRINSKLDTIESTQRAKLRGPAENDELRFFQDRVEKLTALRAKYAQEERELMG